MSRRVMVALAFAVSPAAAIAQVAPAFYLLDPTTHTGGPPAVLCARPFGAGAPVAFNLIGRSTGSTAPAFPYSPGSVYSTAGTGAPCPPGAPAADPFSVFSTSNFAGFTALGGISGGGGNEALYGTPHSIQFAAFQQALNLGDIDVEGAARFTDEGDADTIGAAFTHFSSNGIEGNRLEGRFEKSWRPFTGSRARAIVDVRAQAVWIGSNVAGAAIVSAAVEVPVQPNWSLTGRVGGGGTLTQSFFGTGGGIYTASATSRWRAAQLGRGDLVIGNSVIFTGVTSAGGAKNAAFRNGMSYQFPLQGLVFGRQTSIRLSYVNTYLVGDPVPYDLYHELAVNFGVRLRQDDQKNRFEALRVGLLYTRASHYNAGTLTVGYRF